MGNSLKCLPVAFTKYQAPPVSSLSRILDLISDLTEEIYHNWLLTKDCVIKYHSYIM